MGKNIVVLNGSPRKSGNTAALVERFIAGAQEAGNIVERFDVALMDIAPCRGCLGGGADWTSPCVHKDAMDEVYHAYREADVVVLASPMYCWSITAQLKATLDRLFALMEADMRGTKPKEGKPSAAGPQTKACALIMPAEDASYSNFTPVVAYYEALLGRMGWNDLGRVLGGDAYLVGDMEKHPAVLEEAQRLGASIR